jgi:hypothetical protein
MHQASYEDLALTRSHRYYALVDLYRGDKAYVKGIPVSAGSIMVTNDTGVSRTLSCTIPMWSWERDDILSDLDVHWSALRVHSVMSDTVDENITVQGMFRVDSIQKNFPDTGVVTVSGSSYEAYVIDLPFEEPYTTPANRTIAAIINDLIRPAIVGTDARSERTFHSITDDPRWVMYSDDTTPNKSPLHIASTTTPLMVSTYNDSRWDAVQDLASSIGCEVRALPTGEFCIRYRDTLLENNSIASPLRRAAAWEFQNSSPDDTVIAYDIATSRVDIYNAVRVIYQSAEDSEYSLSVVVRDNDTTSPTYWDGLFGKRVYTKEVSNLPATVQGEGGIKQFLYAEGLRLLAQFVIPTLEIEHTTFPIPHLDVGDVVLINHRRDMVANEDALPPATCVVTSMTIPLTPADAWNVSVKQARDLFKVTYTQLVIPNAFTLFDGKIARFTAHFRYDTGKDDWRREAAITVGSYSWVLTIDGKVRARGHGSAIPRGQINIEFLVPRFTSDTGQLVSTAGKPWYFTLIAHPNELATSAAIAGVSVGGTISDTHDPRTLTLKLPPEGAVMAGGTYRATLIVMGEKGRVDVTPISRLAVTSGGIPASSITRVSTGVYAVVLQAPQTAGHIAVVATLAQNATEHAARTEGSLLTGNLVQETITIESPTTQTYSPNPPHKVLTNVSNTLSQGNGARSFVSFRVDGIPRNAHVLAVHLGVRSSAPTGALLRLRGTALSKAPVYGNFRSTDDSFPMPALVGKDKYRWVDLNKPSIGSLQSWAEGTLKGVTIGPEGSPLSITDDVVLRVTYTYIRVPVNLDNRT